MKNFAVCLFSIILLTVFLIVNHSNSLSVSAQELPEITPIVKCSNCGDELLESSPSPTPVPTASPSSTPEPTPTPTPVPTPSPTPVPTPSPSPTPLVFLGYKGEYFNNKDLQGSPVLTRDDPTIQFDWGTGSPDPIVHPDLFSVRWTKTVSFSAGFYFFNIIGDDGVRVYIDNALILDQWHDQPATFYKGYKFLEAGNHLIKVEYYERAGGAIAKFSYGLAPTPNPNWNASYFNNQTLTGAPALTRLDPLISFGWGDGSPAAIVQVDHFSARWTKQELKRTGKYSFTLKSDDGVRFWINSKLIVDDWTDHAQRTYTPDVFIAKDGLYDFKVEYFENSGAAVAVLNEDFPARDRVAPTPIPVP